MQKTVPRAYSDRWKWKQTHPSRATSLTKARSTVWRPWRTRISNWCFYRMAITYFFHIAFVFIFVITMATKQRLVFNVELGLMGIFIMEWTVIFFDSFQMTDFYFACRKFTLLAIDGGCKQYTVRAYVFLLFFFQRACPSLLSQLSRYVQPHSHALSPRTAWLKTQGTLFVSCAENSHSSSRNFIRCTSLDCTEHGHSFLIFDTVFFTCLKSTSQRA